MTILVLPDTSSSRKKRDYALESSLSKYLTFCHQQGLAPVLTKDLISLTLHVDALTGPPLDILGGFAWFLSDLKSSASFKNLLSSIFGELIQQDSIFFVPFLHNHLEHTPINIILSQKFTELGFNAIPVDQIGIPIPTDMPKTETHRNNNFSTKKIRFLLEWLKVTQDSISTINLKKISSLFDVTSPSHTQKNHDLIIQLFNTHFDDLKNLKLLSLDTIEFLQWMKTPDINVSNSSWESVKQNVLKDFKFFFPTLDWQDWYPFVKPRVTPIISLNFEKILALFLLQEPTNFIKTASVKIFFESCGMSLSLQETSNAMKNFKYTIGSNTISLRYVSTRASRGWIIQKTDLENNTIPLSVNPFFLNDLKNI